MKKIIRHSVFESNSSSTHSLCICTKDEYERWKNGELFYNEYTEKIVERPEFDERFLKKEYFKYKVKKISNGVLYKDTYYKDLDELIDRVQVDRDELEQCKPDEYLTYSQYTDRYDDLEYFSENYTTPGGEEIVAFGTYGYN